MKFYWFGDSWVYGDELEKLTPDWKNKTFAELTSTHFGAQAINLAVNGSSIDLLPFYFSKVKDNLTKNDIIFFFLSSDVRTVFFETTDQYKKILPTSGFDNKLVHPHAKKWYQYFDTPAQRVWNYDRTVNLLWAWCQLLGVRCFFSNIFTIQPTSMLDWIPNTAWLLPKDRCIAQFILKTINNNGSVTVNDEPHLTTQEWLEQKPFVDQYIKPNYVHPNIVGHEKIAEEIIKILETKNVRSKNHC